MALRAALSEKATRITPGLVWELFLPVTLNDERPEDINLWTIRMHVWGAGFTEFRLTNGSGITFEAIEVAGDMVTVPVFRLTKAQTEALRGRTTINYMIDFKAPGGVEEDWLGGQITLAMSPPPGLLV